MKTNLLPALVFSTALGLGLVFISTSAVQAQFGPPPHHLQAPGGFPPPHHIQPGQFGTSQFSGPPRSSSWSDSGPQNTSFTQLPAGVSRTKNWVEITQDSSYRYIKANGLADHATGDFPNSGNPNSISAQNISYRVPLEPAYTGSQTDTRLPGVALNGIKFEPGTAEAWNNDRSSGWNYEAIQNVLNLGLDQEKAHVQPTGAYHYHGVSKALVNSLPSDNNGTQIGWAADGFPIYYQAGMNSSYRLKTGPRSSGPGGEYDGRFTQDYEYVIGLSDLDECNGTWLGDDYVYYATDTFPFLPRCLNGTPDSTFSHGGGGGPGPSSSRSERPREAYGQVQQQSKQLAPGGSGSFGSATSDSRYRYHQQSQPRGQRPPVRQSINRSHQHLSDGVIVTLLSEVDSIVDRLQSRNINHSSERLSLSKSNIDGGVTLNITSKIDEIIELLQRKFPES